MSEDDVDEPVVLKGSKPTATSGDLWEGPQVAKKLSDEEEDK